MGVHSSCTLHDLLVNGRCIVLYFYKEELKPKSERGPASRSDIRKIVKIISLYQNLTVKYTLTHKTGRFRCDECLYVSWITHKGDLAARFEDLNTYTEHRVTSLELIPQFLPT